MNAEQAPGLIHRQKYEEIVAASPADSEAVAIREGNNPTVNPPANPLTDAAAPEDEHLEDEHSEDEHSEDGQSEEMDIEDGYRWR